MFVRRPFLKGAKVWTWRGPYLTSNQAFTGKHVSFTRPSHMNIHARMCSQTHPGTLFYTILWIIIWTISKQRSVKKKNPNNKQTEKHLQIMVFGKKNSFSPLSEWKENIQTMWKLRIYWKQCFCHNLTDMSWITSRLSLAYQSPRAINSDGSSSTLRHFWNPDLIREQQDRSTSIRRAGLAVSHLVKTVENRAL